MGEGEPAHQQEQPPALSGTSVLGEGTTVVGPHVACVRGHVSGRITQGGHPLRIDYDGCHTSR